MQESGFEFKTGQKGLKKVLGPLESDIMELVWAKGQVTVREIHEALINGTAKNLAYTTVMTTMSRLAKKNILRVIKEGTAYTYTPVTSRENFLNNVVGEVVDGLLSDFSEPALAHFVDRIKDVDPVKLQQLADLINRQKQGSAEKL